MPFPRRARWRPSLAAALGAVSLGALAAPAHAATPTFAEPVHYAGATSAHDVAYADVTGDGTGDLIAGAYASGGGLRLFAGTGAGAFDPTPGVFSGSYTGEVAVGRLNDDARPDVVSMDGSQITVRLGAPAGGLQSPATYTIGPRPQSIAVADVSGDGFDDIVVAGDDGPAWPATPSGRLWVLVNSGTGGFTVPEPVYTGANRTGVGVVAEDFDGDGDRDLAVANFGRQDVSIYRNQGAGVFADGFGDPIGATHIDMYSATSAIASGDLTGDGKADLVVAAGAGWLTVLRGDGTGAFTPLEGSYSGGDQVQEIALQDVNGDAKLDAVTPSYADGAVTVLPGAGDGTFAAGVAHPVAQYLAAVLVRDLTGDGKPDIVTASYMDSKLSVLRNTTPYPVPPQVEITTPPLAKATYAKGQVVAADFACTDDQPDVRCSGPVADGAPIDTSTVGQNQRFEVVARDSDGLETRVTHFYDVVEGDVPPAPVRDTTAPDVRLVNPPDMAANPSLPRFYRGQVVVASYSCADASGVSMCAGTVPTGARVDTSKAGRFTFSVTAKDAAGNVRTVQHIYIVEEPAVRAVQQLGGQVTQAAKAAPATQPAKGLLTGRPVTLPVRVATPNVTVSGGWVVAAGGANVVAAGGANVVAAGGANVVAAGGANVVAAGGMNLIGARASAKRKLVTLGRGSRHFAKPGAGKVSIKLTREGKKLLRKVFAKRGRQSVKATYVLGFTQAGTGLPTVLQTRTVTIRE